MTTNEIIVLIKQIVNKIKQDKVKALYHSVVPVMVRSLKGELV